MRRRQSGSSASQVATSGGEQGFWPSYADMMSAVALVLFFLMLLSYIQNLITGNDLQNTQEVLENTRAQLELTAVKVQEAEEELSLITMNLDEAKRTLEAKEKELAGQEALLAEQEALLGEQKGLITNQAAYLAAANEEIEKMRGQMQSIAFLRLSILEQIKDSITSVMGDASKVSIGDNGSIILDEGVFFDSGSFEIKPASQPALNQLIEVFSAFLSNSDNAKYVDSIVISGHTDNTGSAEFNRTLSTNRANSVMNYLLTGQRAKLEKYSEFFCSAGYGATRPIADNNSDAGKAQNRRIEISIILKDDSVMDIVDQYLQIDVPGIDINVSAAETAAGTDTRRTGRG